VSGGTEAAPGGGQRAGATPRDGAPDIAGPR
jgi:hypothetical protein